MTFRASLYGETIEQILALDGGGCRPMPLVCAGCSSMEAKAALSGKRPVDLFAGSPSPEGAMSGIWLYFGCFDKCHEVCQDLATSEGSYWHAILHRREPDAGNAGYWFRHVGRHAVYPELAESACAILKREPEAGFEVVDSWDPFAFVDFCETARCEDVSTPVHRAAREIQLAEWRLLFDYCARPRI